MLTTTLIKDLKTYYTFSGNSTFDIHNIPGVMNQQLETNFGDSDSDDEDHHRFQDEGLRQQLRVTLRRKLNYTNGK